MAAARNPGTLHEIPATPLHVSESRHIVRTRRFSLETELVIILSNLRRSHATGTLMIDLAQGGIGSVRFREEQQF